MTYSYVSDMTHVSRVMTVAAAVAAAASAGV